MAGPPSKLLSVLAIVHGPFSGAKRSTTCLNGTIGQEGRFPVVVTRDWGAVAASPVTKAKACIFWHGEGPKSMIRSGLHLQTRVVCAASELIKGRQIGNVVLQNADVKMRMGLFEILSHLTIAVRLEDLSGCCGR